MTRYYTATIHLPGKSLGFMTPGIHPMQKTPIFVITGTFADVLVKQLEVSRCNDGQWWFRATFVNDKYATAWIPVLVNKVPYTGNTLDLPDGFDVIRQGDAKLPTEWRDGELDFMEFFNDQR